MINTAPFQTQGKRHVLVTFANVTEMQEYAQKLEEKNNELELLNKAMVGRELKMIEMKKQLEQGGGE